MSPKIEFHRACDGDSSAIDSIVGRVRPRLTRMAAYYAARTGEETDDLLQEAWVGLLDAIPNVDVRIGDPEQFLLKQARWRMLDAVKRWKRRRCEPLQDHHDNTLTAYDWDAVEAGIQVKEFTNRLKPVQKTVLQHLMCGMTWRETGDQIGCSSANVAYHVRQIQHTYQRWNNALPKQQNRLRRV